MSDQDLVSNVFNNTTHSFSAIGFVVRSFVPFFLFLVSLSGAVVASEPQGARADPLSLVRAESLWREANPELRLARSALAMADADRFVADRGSNPQISWSGTSINPHTGVGAGPLKDKAVDQVVRIEQLIERGDKRVLRTRAADARSEAATRDIDDAVRQGRIQLHAAYWDLHQAEEREQGAAAAAQLSKAAVAAGEKRVKAGDLARADLARLQVDALRAENDARTAIADRQKAQATLAYMIGMSLEASSLHTSDNWPDITVIPDSGMLDFGRRPDLQAAAARVAAAEAALDATKALNRRDVTVGVQYERYPPAGTVSPNNTWGLSVSVPLFVAHAYEGEIARAEAELDAARQQLERSRAMAIGEFARSRADFDAASERRYRLDRELLPAAEAVATATEFAYSKGASSLMDLIDARRTLRQVQLDAASARADFAKALAALRFQTTTASETR